MALYLHVYKCSKTPATSAHPLLLNLVDRTKQPRLPLQPLTRAIEFATATTEAKPLTKNSPSLTTYLKTLTNPSPSKLPFASP